MCCEAGQEAAVWSGPGTLTQHRDGPIVLAPPSWGPSVMGALRDGGPSVMGCLETVPLDVGGGWGMFWS